uniref:Cyclotide n=1 Tax=Viola tricolor TaxID=214053 RepID=A0A0N9YLE5_9ROSI|nr:cyclotide precursor [Viola tricolor]
MDAKNSLVRLLLLIIAIFALPCLASFERDLITPVAIQAILQKTSSDFNFMLSQSSEVTSKIVVADNLVLEEALLMMRRSDEKLGGIPCGETCIFGRCHTGIIGCACEKYMCCKNSLPS